MSPTYSHDESDADSWIELYGDVLYRFAIARVGRRHLAEDLVQETFVSAWKSRHQFREESSRQTWLIAILKRKLSDHFRRNKRRKQVSDVDWIDRLFDAREQWKTPPTSWGKQPDEEMIKEEFWKTFESCLKKIPRRMAICFEQKEVGEKSAEIICQELGISASNLWVTLHRARLRLWKCLDQNWFEGEGTS